MKNVISISLIMLGMCSCDVFQNSLGLNSHLLIALSSGPSASPTPPAVKPQPVVIGNGPPTRVRSVSASASNTGLPLTFTLTSSPAAGNLLLTFIGYNVYGDYDVAPPDNSWSCTLGGRGANVGVRLNICYHVVAPNDPASYTFTSNTTPNNGNAPGGTLIEFSGVVTPQIGFTPASTPGTTITTPSMIPSAAGSMALAFSMGGYTPQVPTGWTPLPENTSILQKNTLLGTSALTVDLNIQNTYSNAIAAQVILAPGTFASPVILSLNPGSYGSPQQLVLSDAIPSAIVHYTLDESIPTCASAVFSGSIAIAYTTTVTTIACAAGYSNSAVTVAKYLISPGSLRGIALGAFSDMHGWSPWPTDEWHIRVDSAAVDVNSNTKMSLLESRGSPYMRADTSQKYIVVDSTTTKPTAWTPFYSDGQGIHFTNIQQADVAYYPFPAPGTLPIEAAPPPGTITGDNHSIILDRANAALYEMWHTVYNLANTTTPYSAENGTIFDLNQPDSKQRPYGYTSADAGGLSVFEGIVRYDEALSGPINHAIRFTATIFGAHYVNGDGYGYFESPATHSAPTSGQDINATNLIDYGLRIRLKSNFDVSGYSPIVQNILIGMKQYGLLLADQGRTFDFQMTDDPRWNINDLNAIALIAASNFEVVQHGTIHDGGNNYPAGPAPVISSFTAYPNSILVGHCATLTPVVSGQKNMYIDKIGLVRGPVTVCPKTTQTYTLTAQNLNLADDDGFSDGYRPSASVTVTVNP